MKKVMTSVLAGCMAIAGYSQTQIYTVDNFSAEAEQNIQATANVKLRVLSSPEKDQSAWDEKYQTLEAGSPFTNGKYVVGKGCPALSTYDASFTNENGEYVERVGYNYYEPGCGSLPSSGLYYVLTPDVKGTMKVGIWNNKDGRKLYIVDVETKMPIDISDVTIEGYLNNTSGTYRKSSDGNICMSEDYLIGSEDAGYRQRFFGYVIFDVEPGRSYMLFNESSQLGFYGFVFTPEGSQGEEPLPGTEPEPLPSDRHGVTDATRYKMSLKSGDKSQILSSDQIYEISFDDQSGLYNMRIEKKDGTSVEYGIGEVEDFSVTPKPTVSALPSLKPLPDSYNSMASRGGSIQRFRYTTYTYTGSNESVEKEANVYLPYGYDEHTCYDIFYLMHGAGNNITSYLESFSLKNILDHMIEDGLIKPMIVVLPTFYGGNGDTSMYHNELVKDLMPQLESRYSTFARDTTPEALKESRFHRAFGGFSMGGVTTWNIFYRALDYISFFMPQSCGCWSANADQVADMVRNSGLQKDDFFIYALTGDADYAESSLTTWVNDMKKKSDVFSTGEGGNMAYSIYPGGTHELIYSKTYIYNVLPLFFK